ncbi:MAG: gas vesicle protein GvpG [Chloroflexi bacterium]|nr:gas vesicle protein GvpG [Chloroflexota bacterium]MCL5111214.1 gas vesicle protein GvpG [Chloroflexota bacterium]
MGLISNLLLLPVIGPINGLMFITEQIKERIDVELTDESLVEDELVGLSLRYDLGEIGQDEYMDAESALLERLSAIRAYKESLAEQKAEHGALG